MKSKALIAMAVTSAFSLAAFAHGPNMGASTDSPSSVSEVPPAMTTILSLDNFTGGYKGWGPMANLQTPSAVDEQQPLAQIDKEREYKQQLAEVNAARDQVWVANAPLRAEYDNIGASRSEGKGFGRFFGR